MKKGLYALVALVCLSLSSKAAPGDTTWVQANNVNLTYYGTFDTTITFPSPGTSYRKIYMIFTLGKYMCAGYNPANPGTGTGETGWCGDWDYTVQNYLMTPGGDTLELGRLITPYANALAPRTPWTATQHYVYDVTDYVSKLQGSATMRIFFSGYSGGFTGNIKFAFIEGTPDRNVVGMTKLWNGSPQYGNSSNNIDSFFTPLSETAPTGTVTTDLKVTVTGHGSDANGCCEFAAHNYQVILNSSSVASHLVWRDNCGANELYPQSGTWLYRRANWCPGDMVYSDFYNLTGVTAGSNFTIGMRFDPYTVSGSYGVYTSFGTLIYYSGLNKPGVDASIEEIIAPTNDDNHFRENPLVGQPTIHIHNSGGTTINSVSFQYGIQDSAMQTYTWTGTLASLADTVISLAALPDLNTVAGISGTYNFIVAITAVNGAADADPTNDTMRSQFVSAPLWDAPFKIKMYTSNVNANSSATLAETSWVIYNMDNTAVLQRSGCTLNTLYTDTVNLPTGYYQLVIYDSVVDDGTYDGNFYGLNWWGLAGGSYVPGSLYVEKLNGVQISMNGYNYSGTYNNDFGQGYSQYFYVYNATEAVKSIDLSSLTINTFPNPAQNIVNVDLSGMQQVNGKIEIIDEMGRTVSETSCTAASMQIDVTKLLTGVYTVVYVDNTSNNRLQTKLMIAK